jgi:uncharacterized protein (TIGR02246 family)
MTIEDTQSAQSTELADAAIRQVVADAVTHQLDLEPFLALHTDDLVLVNLAGRRVLGKAALREAMAAALQTSLAAVLTTNEIIEITHVGPGAALVSCLKRVTDENESDARLNGLPATASLTYLMVEQDQGWRIALAQTTPIL